MPISSTSRKAGPFYGNGAATTFTFDFKIFEPSELRVVRFSSALGVDLDLVAGVDYSITLNPDQDEAPGGEVILAVAPAIGDRVVLLSDVPDLQPMDLTNQGGFYPDLLNGGLDRSTIQVQQLREEMGRAIKLPPTAEDGEYVLPLPQGNKLLAWGQDGKTITNLDPGELISVVTYGNTKADVFEGDGTSAAFALSASPGSVNNLAISIDGVVQVPEIDYAWGGGKSLVFAVPPPAGTRIFVRYQEALDEGTDVSGKADRSGDNITDPPNWREGLGLGDAATKDVGTGAGSVAAGDDARFASAQQKTFTSSPGRTRTVVDRLKQDFHIFDIITSEMDQEAIRTGTSITDWSDALEEAFGRLAISSQDEPGRVMELPAGQMRFSRTLTKPYAAKLIGKGRAHTRLVSLNGSGHGLVIPEFDQGGYVGGIQLKRSVESDPGTYGLYLSHGTSDVVLDRIGVSLFANGIFGGSTDYGQLIQCRVDDCFGDGWVQQDTRPSSAPEDPSSYDPAVQWHLYKPLVRWCQGAAYKVIASSGGRGVIAGEWNDPGTFENGQSMFVLGNGSPAKGVYDIRLNGGFFGSDNAGVDVETFGKNNEFRFNLIERIGLDAYGPRFSPDGTSRTRSTPGGLGYGRGFRAGTSNSVMRLEASFDDTAGYSVIQACDMIVDVRAKNPGLAADEQIVIKQFAGKLTGQVASEGATAAVDFASDAAHLVRASGAVIGVATPTSVVTTPGGEREALKVAGVAVLTGQETGFTPMSGTARKGPVETYSGVAEATYSQAKFQEALDAIGALSERLKAHDDALLAGKIPKA